MKLSSTKLDILIAGALSLGAVLTRAPYLALIPVFSDEVLEITDALKLQPGNLILTGTDAYAGPQFSYILAACLRVFGATPVAPRIVVMVMGALTVGLTYLLARALGLRWPWAALVGLLMVANPHHILVNSHYAGSSYTVPLFSTAFLLALALSVRRESGPWLVAAGAALGLALQSNPVPVLMLPGAIVWFLLQRKSSIGLRTRWPYLAAAAFLLVYSPVIVYNLQTQMASVREARLRTYAWQSDPSLLTYAQNLERLILQVCRQVSGLLEGRETWASLIGWPLLFSAWALAGLVYAARQGLSLPALGVGSQLLIMPWLSSSYGMISATRYTNQLTPLLFVAMGALAAGIWTFARARLRHPRRVKMVTYSAGALLVGLSLWPLASLFHYYDRQVAAGETNAPHYAFIDEFMQQWRGERVLISDSLITFISIQDTSEFNPTVHLLDIKGVPYDLMPLGRIMERLATGQEKGRVTLILHNDDLPRAQSQADLIAWDSPAIQTIRRQKGYGVYTVADAQQVRKPSFVISQTALAPTVRPVQVNLADQLGVIGYACKTAELKPGQQLIVNLYWTAIGAVHGDYIGFLHLYAPDGHLVAQDDHELGRGFYRTTFWQPGEVIRERYTVTFPNQAPAGEYTLRIGAYDFPSLKRLCVRSTSTSAQDDAVALGTLHVRP